MRKIISLFKSKKENSRMDVKEKNLEDLNKKYEGMVFEWIKGDLSGTMNKYKEIKMIGDNLFIEFQEGGRINEDLVEEYTLYYPAPQQPPAPPLVERSSTVTSIVYNDSISTGSDPDSPIYTLLRKQKKNMVEVSIKIELNLPSKELYGVLSTSFEDAESEIIKFVLDGVDIEDIKKSLSDSIKRNYYSGRATTEKKEGKKINSKSEEDQSE